jgi:hypothetical protein
MVIAKPSLLRQPSDDEADENSEIIGKHGRGRRERLFEWVAHRRVE